LRPAQNHGFMFNRSVDLPNAAEPFAMGRDVVLPILKLFLSRLEELRAPHARKEKLNA
jgi:hypothetical protein